MKKVLLCAAVTLLCVLIGKAQGTSFEAGEGYELGGINGQNGWNIDIFSELFTVSDAEASDGQYALKLAEDENGFIPDGSIIGPTRVVSSEIPESPDSYEVGADMYFSSTEAEHAEVDFYVYGANGPDAMPGSIMALADGLVRIIELSDLSMGAEVEVENDVFTNVKVQFDFINNETLYYVNDELVYTGDLNLSAVTGYGFLTTGKNTCYVDNITTAQPDMEVSKKETTSLSYYMKNGQLSLKSPEPIKNAVFFNILGQKVASRSLHSTSTKINLENLNPGIYFAKIKINGQIKSFKFLRK